MSSRHANYRAHAKQDTDGRTDLALEYIFDKAEIEYLESDEEAVMKEAIERLYYSESIKIGDSIIPNSSIRANLQRLDIMIVQDTLNRLARNEAKIKNSSAYIKVVLYNTIMESRSDLLVDPYLNFLRRDKETGQKDSVAGASYCFSLIT